MFGVHLGIYPRLRGRPSGHCSKHTRIYGKVIQLMIGLCLKAIYLVICLRKFENCAHILPVCRYTPRKFILPWWFARILQNLIATRSTRISLFLWRDGRFASDIWHRRVDIGLAWFARFHRLLIGSSKGFNKYKWQNFSCRGRDDNMKNSWWWRKPAHH